MNVISINANQEYALQKVMDLALVDFKINAKCVAVRINKHLAFFDLKMTEGPAGSSDVGKIRRRCEDISLRIKSKTAPIVSVLSQKGIVRLQVSMRHADSQTLEKLVSSRTISDKHLLPLTIGESDEGEVLVVDFSKNPHTLIAGGTGSGKSVLIHNLIANCVYLDTLGARNIDLYLVDPKQVEFTYYEDSEFSGTVKSVINTYDETVDMLSVIEGEMERRYSLMKSHGYRSLEDNPNLFSQIVVVIDEVADLMIQDKKIQRFETSIVKLAQKARAAGIYLILATQRPSADVITGLIKSNFPARIACKTSGKSDSQVILDSVGAENLMGRGDAIISSLSHDKVRFQVAYADPNNTKCSVNKIRLAKYG